MPLARASMVCVVTPSMMTSAASPEKVSQQISPGASAVQGVGNIRSEYSQIQFVHAAADLFIGVEADSDQSVLPLCLVEQSFD